MDYIKRLKDTLDMMSDEQVMITVQRKDLERLIIEYQKLKSLFEEADRND